MTKHDEISGLSKELIDLREALARQDAPLHSHTRDIAKAKIAKLRRQIKEIQSHYLNGSDRNKA